MTAHRDRLWQKFLSDEIVAVAALISATLPGGAQFDEQFQELVNRRIASDASLSAPAPYLAARFSKRCSWSRARTGTGTVVGQPKPPPQR